MYREPATVTYGRPKPFVKWAGGKRQLLPVIGANMPVSFGRYFEPFLGGGALFFHVMGMARHPCHISDINADLVLAYETIRDRADDLIEALVEHEERYREDSESYYYAVRAEYNDDSERRDPVYAASRLIFLNRTCFNGMYRMNSSGKFNVPYGRYVNPTIADSGNIYAISELLNMPDVEIACRDFGEVTARARKGDFVYFDPPYVPLSKTASFTRYTKGDFGLDDQKRLADTCGILDEMGCHVMLSNSDAVATTEIFADDRWTVERVKASRRINSDSSKRMGHYELLIRNY